jgi:uncharacterized protein HemX
MRIDQTKKGDVGEVEAKGRPWAHRMLTALGLASVLVFVVWGVGGLGFAGDRVRRAEETETREGHLYRQIADRDSVLESQRRIYVERFRKLETELRQKEQEIIAMRARLSTVNTLTK